MEVSPSALLLPYNRRTVAGRAVYRGRMVQAHGLELDRPTQLPLSPERNVKNKKLEHRV
jgi:hypothetical protein